jgi:hypothetical protein
VGTSLSPARPVRVCRAPVKPPPEGLPIVEAVATVFPARKMPTARQFAVRARRASSVRVGAVRGRSVPVRTEWCARLQRAHGPGRRATIMLDQITLGPKPPPPDEYRHCRAGP